MGNTAENVARQFKVSREDQDAFALRSHQKAVAAWTEGRFAAEVVPVEDPRVRGRRLARTSRSIATRARAPTPPLEKLAALKPVFDPTGTVTAGNSSPLNDGAAAVVLMAGRQGQGDGRKVAGYFRAFAVAGVPPGIMGIGPVPAVRKLLAKAGLKHRPDRSVRGQRGLRLAGAVLPARAGAAAGPGERQRRRHRPGPSAGRTGARQIATALHELERRKGRYAVITMCVGGGMGAAGLIERAA